MQKCSNIILRIHSGLLNKTNSSRLVRVTFTAVRNLEKFFLCCTQRALKCDIWVLNNNHFDDNLNIPTFPSNAVIIWQPGVTLWQDIHSFLNPFIFSTEWSRAEVQFSSFQVCTYLCMSNQTSFFFTLNCGDLYWSYSIYWCQEPCCVGFVGAHRHPWPCGPPTPQWPSPWWSEHPGNCPSGFSHIWPTELSLLWSVIDDSIPDCALFCIFFPEFILTKH